MFCQRQVVHIFKNLLKIVHKNILKNIHIGELQDCLFTIYQITTI